MPIERILRADGPTAIILVRIVVGGIFLTEGIQKFVDPQALGVGRFERSGIPLPHIMGPFVACVEVIFGILLLLGLATRVAAIPLLISMVVAIVATKGPVLVGHSFAEFSLQKLSKYEVWSFLHEARTDLLMLFSLAFLIAAGAGRWSLDAVLARRRAP